MKIADLNEAVIQKSGKLIVFSKKLKNGNEFRVIKRNTSAMAGKQDQFGMVVVDKNEKMVKDWGSHPTLAGAKKFADKKMVNEAVDATIKKVADAIKGKKFLNIREPLETIFKKNDIKYQSGIGSGVPFFTIKTGGKRLIIINKKYADDAEMIVGDMAIGYIT